MDQVRLQIGKVAYWPGIGIPADDVHRLVKQAVGELIDKRCKMIIFSASAYRRDDYIPRRHIGKNLTDLLTITYGPPNNRTMMSEARIGQDQKLSYGALSKFGKEVGESMDVIRPSLVIIDPVAVWLGDARDSGRLRQAFDGWWARMSRRLGFATLMIE